MSKTVAVVFTLIVATIGPTRVAISQAGEPARPEVGRCKIERGWPGNVNVHASIDHGAAGGPQYVFKYECNYAPGISRERRCENGGRPFPYEPGHLNPPSKANDVEYMSECNNASVVCCKPRS